MMREIKFRTWDVDEEEWYNNEKIPYQLIDNEGVFYWADDYEWNHYPGEVLIMQYTGLKDKNGVEIYEGDIVRNSGLWVLRSTDKLQYDKRIYGEGVKFVVNLNVTGVELRHIDDWNGNIQKDFAPHGFNSKPYVDSHDAWNLQKTLEVIGNIYENPELLGDSQ